MWRKPQSHIIFGTLANGTRRLIGPFSSEVKAALYLARFGLKMRVWQVYSVQTDTVTPMVETTLRLDKMVALLQSKLHLSGQEDTCEYQDVKHDPLLAQARAKLSNL